MARKPVITASDSSGVDSEAARWKLQIELFERDNESWEKRGEEIIKRYRDERSAGSMSETYTGPRKYNILWSNVQTLKPSLYSREPVPIAERRFLDKDVVGRVASQVLERAMRYEMMDCGFHDTVSKCVYDYLLPGRGVAWLRFTPAIGPSSSVASRGDDQLQEPSGDPVGDGYSGTSEAHQHDESDERTNESPSEKVIGASIAVDYINWKDFLHSKARTWEEVEWVARRIYMTRQDLIDNFGEEIGKEVPLDREPDMDRQRSHVRTDRMMDGLKKATVYEIWCKYDRQVYFVAKGYHRLLEEPRDDPLNLEGFWPCPQPLSATMTSDSFQPVADYVEYQDQAYELDRLTARLENLISSIQVRGVYDGSNKELARLLDEGNENKMIAVKSWSTLAEKGGLKGAVDFVPLEQSVEAVKVLLEARNQVKNDLYEITGLADVIRGQSDPRETAEAVKMKGRFGSMRLQDRQAEIARFCRDIIRMMGEIISEHFPDETLIDVSGIMYDEGIGPKMPTPPKAPTEQPSPMMGHNGGPQMQQIGVPAGGPPSRPAAPGGAPQLGAAAPPNLQPGSPGLQSAPTSGLPASSTVSPQSGMAPPANPMLQYQMDMAKYEMKRQAAEAEKQNLIQRAIALLRQDKLRGFRIDIETDSTIVNEANEDKQSRVEFMQALSGMLEKSMQAAQVDPEIVPLLGKILLFVVRGYRVGRDLESSIEEYIDQKEKDVKAAMGQPKPPDPKVQAEQIKAQAEIQKSQLDTQSAAADHQSDMAMKQLEAKIAQDRAAMEAQHMQMEAQFKERELQLRMQEMELKMRLTEHETQAKLHIAEREHAMKGAMIERQHQQGMEAGEIAHRRTLEAGEAAHRQKLEGVTAQPPQRQNGAGV